MAQDEDYTNIVLEEIRDQNKVVIEAVGQIQDKIKTLATQESLDKLAVKVDTIEEAVVDTNRDLKDLNRRVTALEQAA